MVLSIVKHGWITEDAHLLVIVFNSKEQKEFEIFLRGVGAARRVLQQNYLCYIIIDFVLITSLCICYNDVLIRESSEWHRQNG